MRRALLLDFDGTLVDSLPRLAAALGAFLAARGRTLSQTTFERLNGPPLREVVLALKEAHALEEELDVLVADYRARLSDVYREVTPARGAALLLRQAKAADYRVGIVTSNDRSNVELWLSTQGLTDWVDAIIDGESVARGKPHPEPYATGLARLGATAAASIAVEDSPAGARSAATAGLRTFVIGGDPAGSWPAGVVHVPSLSAVTEGLVRA